MLQDFDYNTVPITFVHCMHSQCPNADNCLRYQVVLHVTPERGHIPVVNPARISGNGENCPEFFSDRKSNFALGITHLLDNIPHFIALEIKNEIFAYFKRNTYYRILHKERLITPAEQKFITRLFRSKGINEQPKFDKYVEQYEW